MIQSQEKSSRQVTIEEENVIFEGVFYNRRRSVEEAIVSLSPDD